jgi:hypothetical protein
LFHSGGGVTNIKWNPKIENIFASAGIDKNIAIWDLHKIGLTQSYVENEEFPIELIVIILF